MFDGSEDGTTTMTVRALLDDVVDLVAEFARGETVGEPVRTLTRVELDDLLPGIDFDMVLPAPSRVTHRGVVQMIPVDETADDGWS